MAESIPTKASETETSADGSENLLPSDSDVLTENRRSEQLFRSIFEASGTGIVLADPETGRFLRPNRKFCSITGYSAAELKQLTIPELTHPEDRTADWEDYRRLVDGDASEHTVEKRYLRKDGRVIWIRVDSVITRDRHGRPEYDIAFIQDITDRKEAERAVRESEERFRTLADNIAQFAWMADETGAIVWLNKRWFEYTGTTLEEMVGWGWRKVVHADHVERVANKFRSHIEVGEPWEDIVPFRAADGEYRWFLSRAVPIRDDAGRVTRWFGTNTDVTEQRNIVDALGRSEERYRALTQAITSIVWTTNPDGLIVEPQPDWEAYTGQTWEEHRGSGWAHAIHPEDREYVQGCWDESWSAEIEYHVTGRVWHAATSEYRYFEGRGVPVRDADGSIREWIGTYMDVHDRRLAEKSLQRERARTDAERRRLQALLDVIPVGVFIADAQGRLVESNRAAQKIWGGPTPLNIEPEQYREYRGRWPGAKTWFDGTEWGLSRAVRGGETSIGEEVEIDTFDGGQKTILSSAVPVRGDDGNITGGVAVSVDITEFKQTLLELEALNENLEQRIVERTAEAEHRARQLRRLTAELTQAEQRERRRLAQLLHDHLQQLLVAAKLNVGLVRRHRDEATFQQTLDQVDQLLGESIDTSRTLTAELSPPVLHDGGLLPALEWLARQMHEKHGLNVEVVAGDESEPDSEELRVFLFQAARELLFNVVKHSGVEAARVETSCATNGEMLLVVADAGRGFDPAAADHEDIDGGFGLFHVRERTEMQGGRLVIDSAPGWGTRVSLYVPPANAEVPVAAGNEADVSIPVSADEAAIVPAGEDGRIRVLLVDDHRILRDGMARMLKDQPDLHLVGEAADGLECLGLARATRPHVIVMDITMPRMDGLEATRRLTAEFPDAKVIGLSMHEHEDMESAMRAAGAVGYVLKGSPSEILLAAIRECVAQADEE